MNFQLCSCTRSSLGCLDSPILINFWYGESVTLTTVFFFILQDWIKEQWEKNYYISSIAGAANGSSLVVMSKGWLITYFFQGSIYLRSMTRPWAGVGCYVGTIMCFQMTCFYTLKQASNRCHFDVQCGVITKPTGYPKPVFCQCAMACRNVGDTL